MSQAEDLRAQLTQLEQEEKRLKKMQSTDSESSRKENFGKSKVYNGTKLAIIIIIVFVTIMGTLGSMDFWLFKDFNMDNFVKFLGSFAPLFITLTGSIGIGGVAKNIAKSISGNNTPGEPPADSTASGEDLARSGEM